MSNILNHNRDIFELKLNNSEYYDFHLNLDLDSGDITNDNCLISYIDTNKPECIDANTNELVSVSGIEWESSVNKGVTLNNIGLTGMDCGLIQFDKDVITKEEFLDLYTNSQLVIDADDKRLHLNKVNGNNKLYSYKNEFIIDDDGLNVAKLNGGFFQGFFKINNGCKYQVLPDTFENGGWSFEFVLKPVLSFNEANDNNSLKTLNDVYPQNKGIFFYLGTRAENKWYKYYNDKTNTTTITTDDDIPISQPIKTLITNNKFITYNRGNNGLRADIDGNVDNNINIQLNAVEDKDNKFITMHHGKGGYTTNTINEKKLDYKYNILDDLFNNAIAFQIKDDGSIGYKLLTFDKCKDNYTIINEWSNPNTITFNQWNKINIRMYNTSNKHMVIMLYVDNKLVLVSKEVPLLYLRELNDNYSKQETVPFNISIGGGTQGLCDVIYEDFKSFNNKKQLILEKEFGGSFIGFLQSFKFLNCNNNFQKILDN